jgi:NAD(P)-dependent dehydrogenase (short-subunit alcohol dehydrogenase family)
MANKIFVITDTTSEIGKTLAMELAKTGEALVIVAPDADQGNAALQEIRLATQNFSINLELCDLSILSSVRNLAEILKSKYQKVDVLINNASVLKRERGVTVDGFEEMFAANYLGPFLLTNLLIELLQAAVQVHGSARVLNISSSSTTQINFDDLQSEKNFHASNAFGASNMANLLFTFALARGLESSGITVNAIHPGSEPAKGTFAPLRLFRRLGSRPSGRASESIVQAATAPELEKTTGRFLRNGKEIEAPAYAYDRTVQQRLWEMSEVLTNLSVTKGVLPVHDPNL